MAWLARLWNTFRDNRARARDIEREIAFHIAERADELHAAGIEPEEAARRARALFGNPRALAERMRDVDVVLWLDGLFRNLRYALRTLRRTPAFTVTAVLTLALGIGANASVFAVVNAVLLQPLPFPHGERLVRLRQVQDRTAESNIAPVRLEEWNQLNSTFEAISGYFVEDVSETSGDFPERIRRAWVAPRFLEVWGIPPALGRAFSATEYTAGGPRVALITERLWRRRFSQAPDAIGRSLRIGTSSFTVVGIMPATFRFPDRQVDVWSPVALSDTLSQARQATWYTGIGRLKAATTLEQARADLSTVQARLAEHHPATDRAITVGVAPLKDTTVADERASLWLLYGAVCVLLLISGTNVAALLASRAAERRQEISIRLSLGASRRAVAGQVFTETCLIAALGAAIGLFGAAAATSTVRSLSEQFARVDEITLGGRSIGYTVAISLAVTLLCGVLPAIQTRRENLASAARDGATTQVSRKNTAQWFLVGVQVALSVGLLAAAALFVRSYQQLTRVDPGFDPSRVLIFRISANWSETARYDQLIQRIDRTLDELRTVPGVVAASTAIFLPGVPADHESTFELAEARSDTDRRLIAESRFVAPEYFTTMQIPLRKGDACERRAAGGLKDLVVNDSFVNRYLKERPTIVGLRLSTGGAAPDGRIVGVVGDARERGLDRDPGPIVYTCFSAPNPAPYFLLRTRGEPAAVAQNIRAKMKALEPSRAVYDVAPLEDRIGAAFAHNRVRTRLLVWFSAAALALACVGLYGTLAYLTTLRRREIALRLALGAVRLQIVRQILFGAIRVVGAASLFGLGLALAMNRVLAGMLYGVSPADPVILAMVLGMVFSVTTIAAIVPALRAAAAAPMQALRGE